MVDGDELAATNWSSEPWRGPDREEVEAEDVEELVVRGTVVDVVEGDDDEEEEGHDLRGWGWPESTPATRCALRCARDGAVAVDLVVLLTWRRR